MQANNSDLFLIRELWKEYVSVRPVDPESAHRTLISVWREYSWKIESAWRGVMQRTLSPTAWNFLSESLTRRAYLRQVWLREGGWLFTKRGTRRKRHFQGQRRPRVGRTQSEVDEAYRLFLQCADPATLAQIDIMLLAASGAFYHKGSESRRRTVERHRNTWGKLDWLRARLTDLPPGVLSLPWKRRRLR